MFAIKIFILFVIFILSLWVGNSFSRKFSNRVSELKELKNALNMFETKLRFTYASVPEIFNEIYKNFSSNVGEIFKVASEKMNLKSADEAWTEAIDEIELNLVQEDKEILKNLRKTFRKNRCRRST